MLLIGNRVRQSKWLLCVLVAVDDVFRPTVFQGQRFASQQLVHGLPQLEQILRPAGQLRARAHKHHLLLRQVALLDLRHQLADVQVLV